jgi:hypothetical protein
METTVTGVFADEARGRAVMEQLVQQGFAREDVMLVTADTPHCHELIGAETGDASRGAIVGIAVGGLGSLLAGAAISDLFDTSMIAGGAIGALLGACSGGLIGLLLGSGTGHMVQEEYEHLLQAGAVLLAVNTDRAHGASAQRLLTEAGATALSSCVHRRHLPCAEQSA